MKQRMCSRVNLQPICSTHVGPIAFNAVLALLALNSLGDNSPSQAAIVVEDRFNDADRDNDGFTDDGNNSPVAVSDGIAWYSVNGLASFGTSPDHKPTFTVQDDSGTDANGFAGIGSGNALAVRPNGQNSDWAGFFGQTITLGPNLGDKLILSLDFRIMDPLLAPFEFRRTLRFGLYQDSDNQLGMASVNIDGVSPTVWGGSDGWFEDCTNSIGTCGDYGIFAGVQSGTSIPGVAANYFLDEEINANISLGGNGDTEVHARADGLNGNTLYSNMPVLDNSKRTISLSLERVAPNATGQDIRMEVAVDGFAFGAQPPNPDGSPGTGFITTRDSFDYFLITDNAGLGEYRIDNFVIELIEAAASLPGDFDGNGAVETADYDLWKSTFGSTSDLRADGNGDLVVNAADYTIWRDNSSSGGGALGLAAAIPEPAAISLALSAILCACCSRRRYGND